MFYKLLVEGSSSFKNYRVEKGIIEFADPDDGKIEQMEYAFKDAEMEEF